MERTRTMGSGVGSADALELAKASVVEELGGGVIVRVTLKTPGTAVVTCVGRPEIVVGMITVTEPVVNERDIEGVEDVLLPGPEPDGDCTPREVESCP
jgi:hypothetical protein